MAKKLTKIPAITEAEFLRQVIDLAHLFGWRAAHFRPARTKDGWRTAVQGDGNGFPDLICVHASRGEILVAELKSGKNKPSPSQLGWLGDFRMAGVKAFLWMPEDWPEIERVLKGE